MKINSAVYQKGIAGSDEILVDGKFQVALMGRSNVGKSTLINSLTGRNKLARSSSSPGKTIRMDFFLINNSFYFVDFPGYGFAKQPSSIRNQLTKMILWYLMYSEIKNRLVILVIDAKVGITPQDADIIKTFYEHRINHIIVANKADNLKMGQIEKLIMVIQRQYPNSAVIPYSSKQKKRNFELLNRISYHIGINRKS